MPASYTGADIRALRAPLLRWYRAHKRDLPWRHTRDPYAIWVSEVMLQQTRVAVVIPYYEKFLRRYPDIATLAAADDEAVLAAWSGLGYYRRARALHAGARQVVKRHQGCIPDDFDALRALPGIGRYTAGAIASLAFDREAPVLDGNVRRVLSRALGLAPASPMSEERTLWALAEQLVQGAAPGDLNQALMELGATTCLPRAPACNRCPLGVRCVARASGAPESFPAPRERKASVEVRVAIAVVERAGAVLLERPGANSPLRGTWDLPAFELPKRADPRGWIERETKRRHGLSVRALGAAGQLRHSILHRRLRIEVFRCRLAGGAVEGRSDLKWVARGAADELAISGATRKALALSGSAPAAASTPAQYARSAVRTTPIGSSRPKALSAVIPAAARSAAGRTSRRHVRP